MHAWSDSLHSNRKYKTLVTVYVLKTGTLVRSTTDIFLPLKNIYITLTLNVFLITNLMLLLFFFFCNWSIIEPENYYIIQTFNSLTNRKNSFSLFLNTYNILLLAYSWDIFLSFRALTITLLSVLSS